MTVTDSVGQTAKATETISVNALLSGGFSYSPTSPLPILTAVGFIGSARREFAVYLQLGLWRRLDRQRILSKPLLPATGKLYRDPNHNRC